MLTMKYFLLIAVCSFFSTLSQAQDLTGVWRGHFRSNGSYERMVGMDDRYKFEVQIAQRGRTFQAVTYSYKTTVFYGKAEAEGTMNPDSKKALLKELKIVEVKMVGGDACIMTCFLQYSKLGDEEYLQGTYTSMNTRDSSFCGKGSVFLRKVTQSDFSKEPFLEKREKEIEKEKKTVAPTPPAKKTIAPEKKSTNTAPKKTVPKTATTKKATPPKTKSINKPSPKKLTNTDIAKHDVPKTAIEHTKTDSILKSNKKQAPVLVVPKVLTSRQNELVKTITVSSNEIELRIYDDGAIDHDTVSVYLDKKIVISHAMLTDRPLIVKIHMDPDNDYHEVVMVAENEGDIPPNTSLMVVQAGDKQYEVRIVSTEQKNATVVFKYENPK